MAMIPAPEYWRNGMAAITAITMQVHTGVCSFGETFDSTLEMGRVLSRDITKHSRIVAAETPVRPLRPLHAKTRRDRPQPPHQDTPADDERPDPPVAHGLGPRPARV